MVHHVRTGLSAAGEGRSKLPESVLSLPGMSSPKVRHLLNNLCDRPGARYLEIGVLTGSTLVSALFGNPYARAWAIENWSEFGGPREGLLSSLDLLSHEERSRLAVLEEDCFGLDLRGLGPCDVYFYDGNHERLSQRLAFTRFDPVLSDPFVAIVDDWNWEDVRQGTREAFAQLGYTAAFEAELPARFNGEWRTGGTACGSRWSARRNTLPDTMTDMGPGVPTLLGLPYDASSSYRRGAAAAPKAIRAALRSESSNSWSEGLRDMGLPESVADAGDLDLPESGEARALIEAGCRRILDRGDLLLALGGDHSVTYPILRALGPRHPGLTVLHVDAHPDLYQEFAGDRYSHASPFARVMEDGLARRLVQVGIRTMNAHQRAQADRFGVEVVDMRAWDRGERPAVAGPVYVSIDLDGFDPAFAPGVSHREPGGLSSRDVLGLIQSLPGPVVGADVVEFNPSQDPSDITAPLCAKLVKELADRMLQTRPR
jgi:agmatinase